MECQNRNEKHRTKNSFDRVFYIPDRLGAVLLKINIIYLYRYIPFKIKMDFCKLKGDVLSTKINIRKKNTISFNIRHSNFYIN